MSSWDEQTTGALDRLHPETRVLITLVAAAIVCISRDLGTAAMGVGCGLVLLPFSGLTPGRIRRLMVEVNLLLLTVLLLFPVSFPGQALFHLGPFSYTREGVWLALGIVLRGNATILLAAALIVPLGAVGFAHACRRLGLPAKLTQLLFFLVRYVAVMQEEYRRLQRAVKLRGFKPDCSFHSLRTFGYLIGVLLLRGVDRSERVLAAMRCRGYRGHFPLLKPAAARPAGLLVQVMAAGGLFLLLLWRLG